MKAPLALFGRVSLLFEILTFKVRNGFLLTLPCLTPHLGESIRISGWNLTPWKLEGVPRVGIVRGWTSPVHVYRRSFLSKIGFKFQSLGKISNISAADPPSVLLGQFQHWEYRTFLVTTQDIRQLKHCKMTSIVNIWQCCTMHMALAVGVLI